MVDCTGRCRLTRSHSSLETPRNRPRHICQPTTAAPTTRVATATRRSHAYRDRNRTHKLNAAQIALYESGSIRTYHEGILARGGVGRERNAVPHSGQTPEVLPVRL